MHMCIKIKEPRFWPNSPARNGMFRLHVSVIGILCSWCPRQDERGELFRAPGQSKRSKISAPFDFVRIAKGQILLHVRLQIRWRQWSLSLRT